jgi:hypothetical protein
MTDAQRFTELTGGCHHVRTSKYSAICRKCKADICSAPSISYDNAADILNRMKEYCGEERYYTFIRKKGIGIVRKLTDYPINVYKIFIDETYILNPSLLLREAIEFLEA